MVKAGRLQITLFGFGYAPLLVLFFINLWQRPHYQFFPLALVGAAFLGWTRLKESPGPYVPGSRSVSRALFGLSFVTLAVATLVWSPWLGAVAALIGVVGLIWHSGGKPLFRVLLPALLLVLIIVPPPLGLDTRFAQYLRVVAVAGSSRLLDTLEVIHFRSGNIIEMPGQKLLVEEACSGINSVLIIMTCALFYGLWRRGSFIRIALGFIAAPSYVLLGNLMRITAGSALKFRSDIDILSGWKHQLIGLLLFAMYVVLVISMDQWLAFLSTPMRRRKRPQGTAESGSVGALEGQSLDAAASSDAPTLLPSNAPTLRRSNAPTRATVVLACAFALLGVVQLCRGWQRAHAPSDREVVNRFALRQGATFVMPDHIGEWRRVERETPTLQKIETQGVYSQIWHYQKANQTVSVALDYPFLGYHDVFICYTAKGWTVSESHEVAAKGSKSLIPHVHAQMQDGLGLYGTLWFSTVDENGRWVTSPGLDQSLVERWKISSKPQPFTFRIQTLVTGYTPLPAAEEPSLQDFFEQARLLLSRQLSTQLPAAR